MVDESGLAGRIRDVLRDVRAPTYHDSATERPACHHSWSGAPIPIPERGEEWQPRTVSPWHYRHKRIVPRPVNVAAKSSVARLQVATRGGDQCYNRKAQLKAWIYLIGSTRGAGIPPRRG